MEQKKLKSGKTKKKRKMKLDMLRSIGKQSGESVELVLEKKKKKKKKKAAVGTIT